MCRPFDNSVVQGEHFVSWSFLKGFNDDCGQGIHFKRASSLTSKFFVLVGGTNGVLLAAYVKVKIYSGYVCKTDALSEVLSLLSTFGIC